MTHEPLADGPSAPPPRLPRNVRLLGAASLLNDIASEMVYPLLPAFIQRVLGGTKVQLGLLEGLAESVSSLLKLWAGNWSDRIGRRKPLVLIGYLLAAVARPLAGLAALPAHLLATRLGDRVGKGLRSAPRDALLAESTPPEIRGRAFGFHRAMDHLGAALGPLLATAFLLAWPGELRWLFLATALPGALVVLLVGFGLREPRTREPAAPAPVLVGQSLGKPFRRYLAALALFTLGNSSDVFLLARAGELGVEEAWLPTLWCAFHLAKSGGNLLCGGLTDRVGGRPLILAGWAVYGLVYLGFAWAETAWQAWVLFLAYALFYALTEPAEKALVIQYAGPAGRGRAFGWFHGAIGLTALPANLLFGAIYERFGGPIAFGWGATLAALAAVLLIRARP